MAAESFDIADVGVKNTAYKLTRPGVSLATRINHADFQEALSAFACND